LVTTDPFILVIAGVFGMMLGSFLNVCIVRLPVDQSVVRPRSRCPRCGREVAPYDNIPVMSWLLLRGKCRNCKEPISIQYPLVELVVGLMWAGAVWYYGPSLTAIAAALFGTILLGIALTDARHYIIPDEFSVGGLGIGLLIAVIAGWPAFVTALIGAATGFGILLFVAWAGEKAFKKEAMGGGDIKMMAMVGAFVGWQGVLLTIFGGSLLGTLVFLPLRLVGKNVLVPFGVFLAAAAGITFVFGDEIIRWYAAYLQG
jgi:leader peptidase (prepilin peptidase)/N-methyltransferase